MGMMLFVLPSLFMQPTTTAYSSVLPEVINFHNYIVVMPYIKLNNSLGGVEMVHMTQHEAKMITTFMEMFYQTFDLQFFFSCFLYFLALHFLLGIDKMMSIGMGEQ